MSNFLNPDQIERVLAGKNRSTKPWSTETVSTCLGMRGKFGSSSYNYAYKGLGWPLVSERTLQQKTQHIKFAPGIQSNMIEALGKKLQNASMDAHTDPLGVSIYAGLELDEMSIK